MLQKVYVPVELYKEEYRLRAVVLHVNTMNEVLAAGEILKSHGHRLKGMELKSSLFLSGGELGWATFFSLVLEDATHISGIIDRCSKKYIELVVPYALFSEELLKRCEQVDRVIVSVQNDEELAGLNEVLRLFVLYRRFPLLQDVPFCSVGVREVKHLSEVYVRREGSGEKPKGCDGCLVWKYCSFAGKGFVPMPIVDSLKYSEVLSFLHNEDAISRF